MVTCKVIALYMILWSRQNANVLAYWRSGSKMCWRKVLWYIVLCFTIVNAIIIVLCWYMGLNILGKKLYTVTEHTQVHSPRILLLLLFINW